MPEDRQELLATLLRCGLTPKEVQTVCGINPITTRKYRDRFIAEKRLEPVIDPATKYARVWHKLDDGVIAEPTRTRLYRLVIQPFEANVRLVFIHPIFLTPRSPIGRLWERIFGNDEDRLWVKIRGSIQKMMSPANGVRKSYCYPSEVAIFESLVNELGSGDHLPDWLGRVRVLEKVLPELNQREQEVIVLRFGFQNPIRKRTEIGKQMGLQPERIRQIELQAINKTRLIIQQRGLAVDTIGNLRRNLQSATETIDALESKIATLNMPTEVFAKSLAEIETVVFRAKQSLFPEVSLELASVPEIPIEELDLTQRTFNCLHRRGLVTLRLLAVVTESDLTSIRGFGKRCLHEVRDKLAEHRLELKPPKSGIGFRDMFDLDDDDDC